MFYSIKPAHADLSMVQTKELKGGHNAAVAHTKMVGHTYTYSYHTPMGTQHTRDGKDRRWVTDTRNEGLYRTKDYNQQGILDNKLRITNVTYHMEQIIDH